MAVCCTRWGRTKARRGCRGYGGTILGALILTVLGTLLTLVQIPEGARGVFFGAIILGVTAIYMRLTNQT